MTEAGAQHSSHWLPIMDDVWDTFAVDAPRQIKVQLKEEPKEEQARMSSPHCSCWTLYRYA